MVYATIKFLLDLNTKKYIIVENNVSTRAGEIKSSPGGRLDTRPAPDRPLSDNRIEYKKSIKLQRVPSALTSGKANPAFLLSL